MSDYLERLHKLLANAQSNLEAIEDRIAEVIEVEHVPLNLLKNKRHWEAEIARFKAEILQEEHRQQAAEAAAQVRRTKRVTLRIPEQIDFFSEEERQFLIATVSFLSKVSSDKIQILERFEANDERRT